MSTAEEPKLDAAIAERFQLKALVEACLVLEEGIAGVREIDLGLMLGTGMVPGPFARADFRGLDDVLAALERAEADWGEHFAPPLVLRRLVAQGRLGAKSGQGFYPYPQPEPGYEQAVVKLDRRGDDDYYELIGDDDGIFGCMSLIACHDVCPKELPLESQIAFLRRRMMGMGFK